MQKNHKPGQFKEFERHDSEKWNYGRLMIGITFLFPFRVVGLLIAVVIYLSLVYICTIGHDFNKPFSMWRRILFKITNKIFPRIALFYCGYITITSKSVDDYDYSKWLGKDYNKPDFCVGSVSNHSAWTDLFVMLFRTGGVSFVSKDSIKKTPLFGKVGIALNTIFFNRVGSKEEKQKIVEEIGKRQKTIFAAKGNGLSLHIFPEGMTTNNSHLLPFKRGVFESLLPLKPLVVKYSSSEFNPAHDVMPMHIHLVVLMSQFTNSLEVTDLPIFEPNKYLYETHRKADQQNWEVYANAVRECMSDISGLPTSEASIKDKNE